MTLEKARVPKTRHRSRGVLRKADPGPALPREAVLVGATWNAATVEQACAALAEDFTPLSDFRASKEYRLLSAQNLLRKYFIELQTPHIETRVTAYV